MVKWLASVLLVLLTALPCQAGLPDFSGVYDLTYNPAKIRMYLVHQDALVRGVVCVKVKPWPTWTFHFRGVVVNNVVLVEHGLGHKFRGYLLPGQRVEGVLHTAQGWLIELAIKRSDRQKMGQVWDEPYSCGPDCSIAPVYGPEAYLDH